MAGDRSLLTLQKLHISPVGLQQTNMKKKITPYFFEDTFQNQFALVHKIATYTNHDQDGHVYIINPTIIESLDIEIIDLTEIDAEDCRLRFHAQDGCLIGFLKGKLPTNSLTAHLIVKNHVLQNYYRENGINDTEDLFPDQPRRHHS